MSKITISYYLAIPALISFIALLIIFIKRRKLFYNQKLKWFWISLTMFFGCYLLIVGSATYNDIYYQWDVNRYDLDKDGLFGGQEVTKEQEAAMQRLTNDLGRNLSFITGLFFSVIISSATYLIGKTYKKNRSAKYGT